MPEKKTIIVIGSDQDAFVAAASARMTDEHARIIMVALKSMMVPDHAEYFHHQNLDLLLSRNFDDETFIKRYSIDLLRPARALALDVDAQIVVVETKNGQERIRYDRVIFLPAGTPKKLPMLHDHHPQVLGFYTLDDIRSVQQAISLGARRALVVGFSLCGIKAATMLKACGLNVTVIDRKKHIMPQFSLDISQTMMQMLDALGIKAKLGEEINHIESGYLGACLVTLSSGTRIECDMVVVCAGIEPDISLLSEAGASLDGNGLLLADDHLLTTLPHVYAGGLGISVQKCVSLLPLWMPHDSVREHVARCAGRNAAINHEALERIRPFSETVAVVIGDKVFARTGLSEHEARKAVSDESIISVSTISDQKDLAIKLLLNRTSSAIIGAEVISDYNALRIVDILALAVRHGLSLDDIIATDMVHSSYQDLLNQAAIKARGAIQENLPIMSFEVLTFWLNNAQEFRMLDVDDYPSLKGALAKKSIHMPLDKLRRHIDDLAQDLSPIVLYSRSGHTSYLAHKALAQSGINNVYQLDFGLPAFAIDGDQP